MTISTRRAFMGMTAGAVSVAQFPGLAMAQTVCVTGPLPGFLPTQLTVDCASGRNFQIFRKNPQYVGLAGVVSMSTTRGKLGSYQAGNLFLFPWLKPKAQVLVGTDWGAVAPINATAVTPAPAIPNSSLPVDEYLCRVTLQLPLANVIGFTVDVPFTKDEAKRDWFSNIDKLADGKGIGIDWTSQNLNTAWFAGSRWIPATDTCSGGAWRKLIADALTRVSVAAC